MRSTRLARPWALLLIITLTACTGTGTGEAAPEPTAPTTSAPAPPVATEQPLPADRACYRLSYQDVLAPTNADKAIPCAKPKTSMTFAAGRLPTEVEGHLLTIDSEHAQGEAARICTTRLGRFLGGTAEQQRLSMLHAVWFTPTLEESEAGADWFRCDVIAVAGDGRLSPLTGRLAGILDRPGDRGRYAMCGTAEPGTADFARVVCSEGHSWQALRTVDFDERRWPGAETAQERGRQPCQDAARETAEDKLTFRWGYEWPTRSQWRGGQTWGICWGPA